MRFRPPAWVEVDPGAVAANARAILRYRPGARLLAVVKEDAYGHGAPAVVRALAGLAAGFAVATPAQGAALRRAGIRAPVLLLGPCAPDELPAVRRLGLTPSLCSERDLARHRPDGGGRLGVHVKFDTGMGRLGIPPGRAGALAAALARRGVRRLAGAFTHLAAVFERGFTARQLDRFDACLGALASRGVAVEAVHAANSGAVYASPRACAYGTLRPGLLLYGAVPPDGRGRDVPPPFPLRPALAWSCRIADVREVACGWPVSYGHTWRAPARTRLAVLPVGYAGGLSRALSGRGRALVRGRVAPFRGRVCMNATLADVTRIPGVRAGDEAVLIGAQGRRRIGAGDVARVAGTIAYEVLCAAGGLSPRATRP